MIQALIFDYFGVVRPVHGVRQTYADFGGDVAADEPFIMDATTAGNYGYLDANAVLAERLGVPLERWLKALAGQPYNDKRLLAYIKQLRQDYNLKLALLSNANGHALESFFEPGEQAQYFDLAIASGDVGIAKPEAAIFTLTAERLGILPQNCLMIDDQMPNCEGAQETGMQAIFYQNLIQLQSDLAPFLPPRKND